jgi:hypothetical protein
MPFVVVRQCLPVKHHGFLPMPTRIHKEVGVIHWYALVCSFEIAVFNTGLFQCCRFPFPQLYCKIQHTQRHGL